MAFIPFSPFVILFTNVQVVKSKPLALSRLSDIHFPSLEATTVYTLGFVRVLVAISYRAGADISRRVCVMDDMMCSQAS